MMGPSTSHNVEINKLFSSTSSPSHVLFAKSLAESLVYEVPRESLYRFQHLTSRRSSEMPYQESIAQ